MTSAASHVFARFVMPSSCPENGASGGTKKASAARGGLFARRMPTTNATCAAMKTANASASRIHRSARTHRTIRASESDSLRGNRMRLRNAHFLFTVAAGLVVSLGVSLPLARGDARSPTIGVDEIHEGMNGYG